LRPAILTEIVKRGVKVIRDEDSCESQAGQDVLRILLKRTDDIFTKLRQRDLDPIELLEEAVRRYDEENHE
jgi:hypothetical protein